MRSGAYLGLMRETSSILETYSEIVRRYESIDVDATRDPTDVENATRDEGRDLHYLAIGREAAELCIRALVRHQRRPPTSVLDFACGSGRVTRHLVALFPDARIAGCDLYAEHLDFCVEQFGIEAIQSKENPDEIEIEPEWDLIFVGSLLTHLPEDLFAPTLRFLARALSPNGIALVTLEGRRAEFIQDNLWKLIEERDFKKIRRGFHRSGFGFSNYGGPTHRLFPQQDSYGIALVKPSWVMSKLEAMSEIAILGYEERAWDNHQDLLVIGKPGPFEQ
jgi:SAM-dependent methyltransferase